MYIKNFEEVRTKLLKFLPKYLKQQKLKFGERFFQCPNHKLHNNNDEKPSAAFFPDSEHFKCFSCNLFGDIFVACSYLEGRPAEGPGFLKDNFLYIAKKFGVEVELIEEAFKDKEDVEIGKLLKEACKMMKSALSAEIQQTQFVRDYIKNRGWSELYDTYDFGYCKYSKLVEKLAKRGYSEDLIKEAGLGLRNRPLLNNRLVFPIRDEYQRIIGFASRRLEDEEDSFQKYLNSTTTKLYKKSNVLFNLDKARGNSKLYVVEGYADVFTLHHHGVKNVAALCDLSFNLARYALLIKHKVKTVVFCLDSDKEGQVNLIKMLREYFLRTTKLKICIKKIEKAKDPDEFVTKYGVKEFLKIKEVTLFDYFLNLYKETNDVALQNDLFRVILNEPSFITKEYMTKAVAKVLQVKETTVLQELQKFEVQGELPQLIKTSDLLLEKASFEKAIVSFDEWSQRRGQLLGLRVEGFPMLSSKMDGIQSAFYLVGGRSNVGKTCFCLSLAYNLLRAHLSKLFILFFSLDDSTRKVIPRLIATDSGMAINDIMNPVYRIEKNKELDSISREAMLRQRAVSIDKLKKMSENIVIKDAANGYSIHYIEKLIKIYQLITEGKQLVVFVDSFHKITNGGFKEARRESVIQTSKTLKRLCSTYNIPIITTVELRKQSSAGARPDNLDIKEAVDLEYDADAVFMLHSDFYDKEDTELQFVDDGKNYPLVEVKVTKNKTSSYRGKLFYKFYPELSRMVELTWEEIDDRVL